VHNFKSSCMMYCTNSIQSNDKLEQTSSKQHYLLINLCLKINATGNPECTLFNSECTISAGNTLRIGTVAYTYNRRSLIKLHSSPVHSQRTASARNYKTLQQEPGWAQRSEVTTGTCRGQLQSSGGAANKASCWAGLHQQAAAAGPRGARGHA